MKQEILIWLKLNKNKRRNLNKPKEECQFRNRSGFKFLKIFWIYCLIWNHKMKNRKKKKGKDQNNQSRSTIKMRQIKIKKKRNYCNYSKKKRNIKLLTCVISLQASMKICIAIAKNHLIYPIQSPDIPISIALLVNCFRVLKCLWKWWERALELKILSNCGFIRKNGMLKRGQVAADRNHRLMQRWMRMYRDLEISQVAKVRKNEWSVEGLCMFIYNSYMLFLYVFK